MTSIRLRDIIDECFQDYYKPAMLLATSTCNWKCLIEQGLNTSLCQNSMLCENPIKEIEYSLIAKRYKDNPITTSIIIGGLEPFLQFDEIIGLVGYLRSNDVDDDVVIYTGYNKTEIVKEVEQLQVYQNIIVKFGRFIPNHPTHYDDVLKINLVSNNQYAERIS